jgi:hypothetical protein
VAAGARCYYYMFTIALLYVYYSSTIGFALSATHWVGSLALINNGGVVELISPKRL